MSDSAEILSKSFLQEAVVSSSGMGRDVQSWRMQLDQDAPAVSNLATCCCHSTGRKGFKKKSWWLWLVLKAGIFFCE